MAETYIMLVVLPLNRPNWYQIAVKESDFYNHPKWKTAVVFARRVHALDTINRKVAYATAEHEITNMFGYAEYEDLLNNFEPFTDFLEEVARAPLSMAKGTFSTGGFLPPNPVFDRTILVYIKL